MNFAQSVLASVLGTIISAVMVATISRRVRAAMAAALSWTLGVDLVYIFRNKVSCNKDLASELKEAQDVRIFTGRGDELRREEMFVELFRGARTKAIRVLLPEAGEVARVDWTEDRAREMELFDPGHSLRVQIESNAKYITEHGVQLRRYNFPHFGRIIMTERVVYFTPYRADAHGRECKIYKYRRGTMYDSYARLFEKIWTHARENVGNREVLVTEAEPEG